MPIDADLDGYDELSVAIQPEFKTRTFWKRNSFEGRKTEV